MAITRMDFLETVVAQDPRDIAALVELGWLCELDRHDFDRAVETLSNAISIDPERTEAYFWLAKVYYHDGAQFEEATAALERALQCDPTHIPSMSLLAAVCLDMDEAARAVDLILEAARREPSWVLLHSTACEACVRTGKREDALRHAGEALRLAREFRKVSTEDTYSYYEHAVTGRWVTADDLNYLEHRARLGG